MKSFNINGQIYACKIYQQKASFPYLLMLHGFMGDHRAFDHLIDKLCPFCNPVTIDLLGHGQSSSAVNPEQYREEQQMDDIVTLIHRLNISPVFLYGYSMGGRLALKTALVKPGYFEGLILESTHCGIVDKNTRKERRQTDESRAREIELDFEGFLSQWETLDLFKAPLNNNPALKQKYHHIQSDQTPAALAASLRGFGAGSMEPVCNQLGNLDRRILLMAGSADTKYQQINRHLVNLFPCATFLSIKAGHRVHLDNPSAFIKKIKLFLP